jgi:hypothetical protein
VRGHASRGKQLKTERYLEEDHGYETPCWIWQLSLDRAGYGRMRSYQHKSIRAHKVMWEKRNGPVPDGLHLDHLCRVPPCVNPDHLEPVTNRENILRGNTTKLSLDAAHEIRASSLSNVEIARQYGVHPMTIGRLRRGEIWVGDHFDVIETMGITTTDPRGW